MGAQRLLLTILGVLVLVFMVAVSISLFSSDTAMITDREQIQGQLRPLALRAQLYYQRPKVYGGGEHSFNGLTIEQLTTKPERQGVRYELVRAESEQVVIAGIGQAMGTDGNPVRLELTVFPDSSSLRYVNCQTQATTGVLMP